MARRRLCARCKNPHSRYRDKAHTVLASYCRSCHAAYMREEQRPREKAEREERRRRHKKMIGR